MRVYFHESGLLEELRYRLQHPAALLIVLPNGLVKLINALPFVCGDFRLQSLQESGPTSSAPGTIRALRNSSTILRPTRARPGRCTNGSISDRVRCAAATAVPGAAAARILQHGALPVLPLCRAPALSSRCGVGLRDGRHIRRPRFSGAGLVASCSRLSASKHSTSISIRAWAPTASSTRQTSRRCPTRCSGSEFVAFAGALAVGIYLTVRGGWPILAFALLGGIAAIFYVAPPIRWAYRGLGELVIALSYGPWMVLGSLYLHTHAMSWDALFASLVPGCLIMALAVVNAIPDYHQDRLVGKRNLVVRLGRRRGVSLYLALAGAGLRSCRSRCGVRYFPGRLSRHAAGAAGSLPAAAARSRRSKRRACSFPRCAASSAAISSPSAVHCRRPAPGVACELASIV